MVPFKRPDSYYDNLWNTLQYLPDEEKEITKVAAKVVLGWDRYAEVSKITGVPTQVIGIIHQMEASGNWDSCIHNGESWKKVTTLVPKGHGPFKSWEDSAVDALTYIKDQHMMPTNWTLASTCRFFEEYNGTGYGKYHQKNSPYLYSFSNHGVGVGKYVGEKAGVPAHWDANAVSDQCGAVVILKKLYEMNMYVPIMLRVVEESLGALVKYNPDDYSYRGECYQKFLADSFGFSLKTDGKIGPKTSAAHKVVFGEYLIGDPRRK